MKYTLFESGRTGPSANIGGSSPYHIDSKFSTSLGEDEARRMFEAKVRKYAELGRNVEFSNKGVAGMVYDLNADEEQRAALFRKAYGAHAPREGFYSLDYYAPLKGDTRWDKSAEGAPIFAVGPEGSKRETGTGGNYGFYSLITGPNGNLISKVGHGDDRYPMTGDGMVVQSNMKGNGMVAQNNMTAVPKNEGGSATPAPQEFKTPDAINAQYDKLRMAGDIFEAEKFGMEQNRKLFG